MSNAVHPRMCRADATQFTARLLEIGSPPHVRGRRRFGGISRRRCRFTPACAGQTGTSTRRRQGTPVHPRMCGADTGRHWHYMARAGSPPHVRGRRKRSRAKWALRSVHPRMCGADGQLAKRPFACRFGVHPRMCGAEFAPESSGSPPHVRGRQRRHVHRNGVSRFTPACAGQTPDCPGHKPAFAVHPRMCGADAPTRCNRV